MDLLKKLTLTPGISGYETQIAEIMKKELNGTEFHQDNLGSILFEYKGDSENPKILFLAHMDEIGFIVSDMTKSGFIKLQNIGGWDPNTLLSSPVEVINSKGVKYPGIIGSVPVHFQKNKTQQPDINNMLVDVGAKSLKDLQDNFGINLGDQIIPVTNYHFSSINNLMFSKAFDDRAGIAAVIELGKALKDLSHPNTVFCGGSVQEEVGTRGAISIANRTDADVCIILEGAPADDFPGISNNPQTALGKGVHVRIYDPTLIVKKELKDFIIETAKKNNIKYQTTVRKGGGTDGRAIHTANYGIPTIVLGVPVRYAHSHNCIASLDDFDELNQLLVEIVKSLNNNVLKKIISN